MITCPECGKLSPNDKVCTYCGYILDEKLRKLEAKKK